MLLQTHYKTQFNFTFAGLDAVKGSLQRLQDFILRLQEIHNPSFSGYVQPLLEKAMNSFAAALADDLNISAAFAALFDMVREINALCDAGHIGKEEAQQVLETMKRFNQVLGVLSFEKQHEEIPKELEEALAKRQEARKQKNWALADSLRDFILGRGYVIEDTPEGVRLKKG
jgi:cysteinyl-tRNA synthetase